jgi:hypothetical protein
LRIYFRVSRVGAVCRGGEVRLWSRNGKDFTAKFPDVQAALAAQVRTDCVLDGELVVWTGDRMDFDALQQRMVNTAATVRRLAAAKPASFVAFDVLAVGSVDVRPMRWTARRGRLESLAAHWAANAGVARHGGHRGSPGVVRRPSRSHRDRGPGGQGRKLALRRRPARVAEGEFSRGG